MPNKNPKQIDAPQPEDSELSELKDSEENVSITAVGSAYSGPLPAPATIKKYENILPGSAERIFKMAEKEQAHRIDWEITHLKKNYFSTL